MAGEQLDQEQISALQAQGIAVNDFKMKFFGSL